MNFSEDLLVVVKTMARKREIGMEAAGKCLKIEWHDDTYTITKPNGGRIVGIGKDRAARFINEYSLSAGKYLESAFAQITYAL